MTNHYTDVCEATIASLRQQVTLLRDELGMVLGIIDPEEYPHTVAGIKKALAVMPGISEWKTRWQKENDQLRQQLAAMTEDRDRLLGVMCEIAGSKSLTATPTQFYQHLQRVASNATITNPEALAATKETSRDAEIDQLRQQLAEANRKIEYEQLCASELERQLALLKEGVAEKNLVIERLKAREDALMLELEQFDNWAAHQRAVPEHELPADFKQVAEVVKNPSSQIRIVGMDGNAFDLCDNVGLKLYAKKED